MPQTRHWHGVPPEKWQEWSFIFSNSREGINVSSPCPVCGSQTLHRYLLKGRPIHRFIDGEHFIASGASWEWCSTCHSYEHSQVLIPEWWKDTLDVETSQLTAEPEALELALTHR